MIDHDNLEEFADPAGYDRKDSSDTGVAFYAALAREAGGPVLEIACGTGPLAIPIARQGFTVTGLDVVPDMLELARSKSAGLPVRWVEGEVHAVSLYVDGYRMISSALAYLALTPSGPSAERKAPTLPTRRRESCHPRYRCTDHIQYIADYALPPYLVPR